MPTDRGSSKHGPLVDDEMGHEAEGYVHSGRDTRAQEWPSGEPATGEEPATSHGLAPDRRGTPAGMSAADVEERSELAQWLGRAVFPADRDTLLRRLREENAPDHVIAEVGEAPTGVEFGTTGDLWRSLRGGAHVESHRH